MSNLRKLRLSDGLKWISLLCMENKLYGFSQSNLYVNGALAHGFSHPLRFYSTETVNLNKSRNLSELAKKSLAVRSEAQDALIDYFHGTRGLQFQDAENMSKNTPEFFYSFGERVDIDAAQVKRSLSRFLRYHPINEFEPFFESIGLKPSEYSAFLPRNMMFLSDDELLLENYCALCNYGIERNRIGRIYMEATEIFRYDYGVLSSKLQFFQNLGLQHTLIAKIILSSPRLLVGNVEFVEFLSKLKRAGVGYDWLEEHISVEDSYDWKHIFEVMCLFSDLGMNEEQIGQMCKQHSHLFLECSGRMTILLFGLSLKFGSTLTDVRNLFLQFPQGSVVKFINNLHRCHKFFIDVDMGVNDIGWFVRSHPTVLGSCEPKQAKSLLNKLNCGKTKLCQVLKDDPYVLKKWVLGLRVDPLPGEKRAQTVRMLKTKFLVSLGYVDKSKEMEKALKAIRGRGAELHERFDCLMNIGLSREEAIQMIRVSPRILNQTKDFLETKLGFLVNEMGIPVSELANYPKLISYTIQRVKLRLSFHQWLKDKGAVSSKLALSTLLASSDKEFVNNYVESHPRGPAFWKKLKKEIESD